jgi:hypothetical protein
MFNKIEIVFNNLAIYEKEKNKRLQNKLYKCYGKKVPLCTFNNYTFLYIFVFLSSFVLDNSSSTTKYYTFDSD